MMKKTTLRVSNLARPTPVVFSRLGNGIVMLVLAVQPFIADAGTDVLSVKAKFWTSIGLSMLAVIGKFFTMMLDDTIVNNGNQ